MNKMKPEDVMRAVAELRKHGLSSGGTLGYHAGWCDEIADLLESVNAFLREKDAEIERVTKERDLANAEREANVKGFTEELQNTIDRYKGVIRILEQDVADRDKLLEGKVEATYSEFMRDYKHLQEEYNDLAVQIVDEFAAKIKERMGEASPGHIYDRDVDEVARDLKEDFYRC